MGTAAAGPEVDDVVVVGAGFLNHVADRFGLRRDIVFDARVTAAGYDAARAR